MPLLFHLLAVIWPYWTLEFYISFYLKCVIGQQKQYMKYLGNQLETDKSSLLQNVNLSTNKSVRNSAMVTDVNQILMLNYCVI